jgi:hypothetical protein
MKTQERQTHIFVQVLADYEYGPDHVDTKPRFFSYGGNQFSEREMELLIKLLPKRDKVLILSRARSIEEYLNFLSQQSIQTPINDYEHDNT